MADKEPQKKKANFCDICRIACSSALQLCEHVVGHKHRTNAKRVFPDCLSHVYRLQYFIDKYIELEPLLGLEYVEEMQKINGCHYQYSCRLCGFHGCRQQAFQHITGPEHISEYLDKHHPDLSVHSHLYPKKHQKGEYIKALQVATEAVFKTYGRKTITETVVDQRSGSPTSQKGSKCSSDPKSRTPAAPGLNGDFHTKSLRYLERKDDGVPGFKGNGDFLDYLKKFQIRSDDDALIVKQIMHNCTQALMSFRQQNGGPADDRTNRGASSGKVASTPTSESQTDVTKLFFDHIKNTEASEVVNILQKLAATNPAFRSINIPNVMRYLQATGRLKTA